jgi:very-short-patch-repair endonuclease
MPRPHNPAKVDHAIELYLAGEPLEKILATCGISTTFLHRERNRRGIPPRRDIELPMDAISAAYLAGASEYALGRQYGVSRNVIQRRLAQLGIERRTPSAAGLVRAKQMTAEQRRGQAKAANAAARKRRVPEIDKLRHALSIERTGASQSRGEDRFAEMLTDRNVSFTQQRAIGIHNVDFAVLPVAVEILGGGWHAIKTCHAERTPDILDRGWHLFMVWDYEGSSALGTGAADYLVSFLEEIGRNPPATCQYRVVSGQGELLAARGREDNEFPLVPPPRGR